MELIAAPIFEPGCCCVCLTSSGPCVDTRRFTPLGGRVYVCVSCARSVAAVAGVAPAERDELAALRERVAELEEIVEEGDELRQAVARTLREGAVIRKGRIDVRGRKGKPSVSVHT